MVAFRVAGIPAPQGSHKAFVVNGRAIVTNDSAKTKPWRALVTAAARSAMHGLEPFDCAVQVAVTFEFVKPASVRKRLLPTVKPDIDKLARALLDGLTDGGVFTDDARVTTLIAHKKYAETAGAIISVVEVTA